MSSKSVVSPTEGKPAYRLDLVWRSIAWSLFVFLAFAPIWVSVAERTRHFFRISEIATAADLAIVAGLCLMVWLLNPERKARRIAKRLLRFLVTDIGPGSVGTVASWLYFRQFTTAATLGVRLAFGLGVIMLVIAVVMWIRYKRRLRTSFRSSVPEIEPA